MVQAIDPKKAARTLAVSAWRRDYEQSLELRTEAFNREVITLFDALKGHLGQLVGLLHDEHGIEWTGDHSLRITEGERKERVVDCHLNLATPGKLGLQLLPRFGNQLSEDFLMVRNGRENYGWTYKADSITTEDLAALIIQLTLEAADRVVSHGIKNNPKM